MSRLDFNKSPYYDDFTSSKNFMKILFKPGVPVQVRELNTMQSITQNQIEKLANHIFDNGSRISNARANFINIEYVRLQNLTTWIIDELHPDGYDVDLKNYKQGLILIGETSGIKARLLKSINAINDDPPTIYVLYIGTAIDGETSYFLPGETINIYDDNDTIIYSVQVRCPNCVEDDNTDTIPPTGKGAMFTIDEGVFYFEGLFIENSRQDIIISKYGELIDYKIGFDFIQYIINSDNDVSLLDNTLGYPNMSAPGADRYQVDLVLTKRTLDTKDGDNFILLAVVEKGNYRYLKENTDYADIMDMIAKRTYEINGNFTVKPFNIKFIEDESKAYDDPNGYSLLGNPDYVRAVVDSGIFYVNGYRLENSGKQYIPLYKARNTKKIASVSHVFDDRTYIHLKPLISYSAYPNNLQTATNTDTSKVLVYNGSFDGGKLPTGTLIATFRVYDVRYVSGVINTDAVFKYYIYDLVIESGYKLSAGLSFVTEVAGFKAEPTTDNVEIYNPSKMELIWESNRDNIKSFRRIDSVDSGGIMIPIRKKLYGILNSNGSITFTSVSNEWFQPFDKFSTIAIMSDNDEGAGITHTIDLNIGNRIEVTPTTLTLNLGTTIDVGGQAPITVPGNSIMLLHNVLKINAKEDIKELSERELTNITPTNNDILLGISDIAELVYAKEYNPNNLSEAEVDISEFFTIEKELYASYYKECYLKSNDSINIDVEKRWKFKVKYFNHNRSNNFGYFTIDSYKQLFIDDVLDYEDNLTIASQDKTIYPLYNCFDFRPSFVGGQNYTNFVGSTIPVIGGTVIFDVEFFVGRTDLLLINKEGIIYFKNGTPSETPTLPTIDENAMPLYEIYLKPYTYSIADISIKEIKNKRYTMSDIAKLESRIKSIEYYVVLNLLEKNAQDMSIKDANGLDRFKNGFIADNFQEYQAADVTSSDFKAALDRKNRELRPAFTPRNKKLIVNEANSNAKFLGKMAYIDYDSIVINEQLFATKHISINPYFQYKKVGEMVLTPNNDVWSDTTRQPELTLSVDTGVDALRSVMQAAGVLGTEFGSWATLNKTIKTDVSKKTTVIPPTETRTAKVENKWYTPAQNKLWALPSV